MIFFDAIEPKAKDGGLPSEIDLAWTVTPAVRGAATTDPPVALACRVPIAVRPSQVPRIVSAGLALSPYQRSDKYASTSQRRAAVWLELAEPPTDPRDAYFVRVLCHGPDPVLSESELSPPPDEPELSIDPELVRMITPGESDDHAGLQAMTRLVPSASPVHFLVPLPKEIEPTSQDLFGFFTYELRIGHADSWSTAQARFGRPLRITGLQHPPPPLVCSVQRRTNTVVATAPLAVCTSHGRIFTTLPRTSTQFMLYAQVMQADGTDWRNVLLSRRRGQSLDPQVTDRLEYVSYAEWSSSEIQGYLNQLALPRDARLSVLAVELYPGADRSSDPLGADLGHFRILRASPLVPLGADCGIST
jgi:hypothetical protein